MLGTILFLSGFYCHPTSDAIPWYNYYNNDLFTNASDDYWESLEKNFENIDYNDYTPNYRIDIMPSFMLQTGIISGGLATFLGIGMGLFILFVISKVKQTCKRDYSVHVRPLQTETYI